MEERSGEVDFTLERKRYTITDLKPLRLNMCNKTEIHEVKCEVYNCRIAEILF